MKHKVIIDCDNTFGVPGRPIDDGQTILYLLGRDDIDIVGITTTFGNSTIEDVYPATCWLMEQLGRTDIPVLKGAGSYSGGATEASRFLAETAAAYPGEIELIAIGTMANLKAAHDLDPAFFGNLKQIVTMGGYLHRLPYKGWTHVGEVNFSGDGEAAWTVFRAACPVVIFNAHICFAVPFGFPELEPIAAMDRRQYFIMKELLLESSAQLENAQDYLWDLLPALYISYPELFHRKTVRIVSTPEQIEAGYLTLGDGPDSAEVLMPDYITDIDRCYEIMYNAWSVPKMNPEGPWFEEWKGKKEVPADNPAAGRKVIVDSSLLFGLPGERVDEALALMYLAAREEVDILGLTLVQDAKPAALHIDSAAWLLRVLGMEDSAVVAGPGSGKQAAAFLAETAAKYPGEVTIISLGPLTNVAAAADLDPGFYSNVGQVIVLGGQYHPFQEAKWGRKTDLTLSTDRAAAERVLKDCPRLSLVTMQAASLFRMNMEDILKIREYSNKIYYLVKEYLSSPVCFGKTGKMESCFWSLAPALYAVHPELFETQRQDIDWANSNLELGELQLTNAASPDSGILFPGYITDIDAIFRNLHDAWAQSPLANRALEKSGGPV